MKINNYNVRANLADAFLISALFPFVSFNLTPFDTQPFTLILGIICLIFSVFSFHINKLFRISFVLVLIALFISSFLMNGEIYYLIRALYNFFSFFFFLFLFSDLFRKKLVKNKLIIISNYIYLFFAFLQIYFPTITSIFVRSRIENSFYAGRGLSSLTPEPSHLGTISILISILLFITSGYRFRKNIFLHVFNIFSVIALSRSASIVLVLIIGFLIFGIFNIYKIFNFKYLKFSLIYLLFIFSGIFYSITYRTRIFRILENVDFQNIKESLFILINADRSISMRLQHFLIPLIAFFRDFGIPHAFNGLYESAKAINLELNIFAIPTSSIKFMSFLGDWIYSLGIFGVVALFIIFIPLFNDKRIPSFLLITFIMLLVTAVPISTPLVPAVISGFYHGNDNPLNINKNQFKK